MSEVFVLLIINILNTGIGFIARDLTNALVKRDGDSTYRILTAYAACFIVALPIRSAQFWFTAKLSILWREWLTRNFIDSYMSHRAYYELWKKHPWWCLGSSRVFVASFCNKTGYMFYICCVWTIDDVSLS
ncbi:ABC transporter D family member 2 [Durusdinium trenchii]|uniref:Chloroplastic (ABC transporter ABCD.2) (AtABCD2) n=1 Tax=Durusdinium trenchii TaxID=1381693 RepID=A0ABP0HCQ4_9DINO